MRRRLALPLAFLAGASAVACARGAPWTGAPAPTGAATAPPPSAVLAPRPAPTAAEPTAVAEIAGRGELPLTSPAPTTVPPTATFRITIRAACADARVTLLDAADAVLPGTASRELDGTTRLALGPASPLPAGAHLRLRLDGATSAALHDAAGGSVAPREWPLVVAGDPPSEHRPPHRGRR